jgi:hypothetical protein
MRNWLIAHTFPQIWKKELKLVPIFLILTYVSVKNKRNFLHILITLIQPILLSFTLFLRQYVRTVEAVIFKFTSNSKHPQSHISRLKTDYYLSDMFTNNKDCFKNIFFIVGAVAYSAILFYNTPTQPLTSCTYSLVLLRSGSAVCHFYTETACSTFPLVNPWSWPVVFAVSVWFPNLEVSQQIYVLRCETVSLTPNPQPGGPGYPFLSGSSPLICLVHDAIPVASLPPA